jgi:2-(1,2-epoxy-1,2-dihydrophenyl)acetyl-CoA isomerase
MYTTLQLEQRAGIGVLTLSLPDKRNAMSEEMAREFPEVVARLRQEPDLRVVIVTGSGSAFSAGGDTAMLSATPTPPISSSPAGW